MAEKRCENPIQIQDAFYKCYVFLKLERLSEGITRDNITHDITELGETSLMF